MIVHALSVLPRFRNKVGLFYLIFETRLFYSMPFLEDDLFLFIVHQPTLFTLYQPIIRFFDRNKTLWWGKLSFPHQNQRNSIQNETKSCFLSVNKLLQISVKI